MDRAGDLKRLVENAGAARQRVRPDDVKLMLAETRDEPFSGDDYEFGIEGQGMGNADYQELIDRITKARAAPRK